MTATTMRVASSAVAVGVRLAASGGRGGWARLALMTAGVAVGVALLFGVGGILPAAHHRADVAAARYVIDAPSQPAAVAGVVTTSLWRGHVVTLFEFDTQDNDVAEPPLGLANVPDTGTTAVSPALWAVLAGPERGELASRIPGDVTTQITRSGLTGPDELYAIAAQDLGDRITPSTGPGFEQAPPGVAQLGSSETPVAAALAGLGLLIPIGVLVGVSVRLSAGARERRNAAIRLVGATRGQMVAMAAVENAVVGAGGSLVGAVLFFVLRPVIARLTPVQNGLWSSDVAPGWLWMASVVLGVPVFAALIGAMAQRRISLGALGISRQSRPARTGWWRIAVTAGGLVLLVVGFFLQPHLEPGSSLVNACLYVGVVGLVIGLAVVGASLARLVGTALSWASPGPSTQLAGRRLMMEPRAAGQAVAGAAIVVVVAGVTFTALPSLQPVSAVSGQGGVSDVLRPGTMLVTASGNLSAADPAAASQLDDNALSQLREVPGVTDVLAVKTVALLPPGGNPDAVNSTRPQDYPFSAVIASCEQLRTTLTAALPGCATDQPQLMTSPNLPVAPDTPAGRYGVFDNAGSFTAEQVDLDDAPGVLPVPAGVSALLGALRLPPSTAVPQTAVTGQVIIGTDDRETTREGVRAQLAQTFGSSGDRLTAVTSNEQSALESTQAETYHRAALLGLLIVVFVGALLYVGALADDLRERAPAHTALTAVGVPVGVLRRSIVWQVITPLLLTTGVAAAVSLLVGLMFRRLDLLGASEGPAPLTPLWVAGAAVVAGIVITIAVLPLVRPSAKNTTVRTG